MATTKLQSEAILHRLLTTSGVPALANLADRSTMETVTPEAAARIAPPDSPLAAAYWQYWSLPESQPMATFEAQYDVIAALERKGNQADTWQTLFKAASAYHAASGVCPFCRMRGELHLPGEYPVMELSGGAT